MTTRAQLTQRIARDLGEKSIESLTFATVQDSVTNASPNDRARLLDAYKSMNTRRVGELAIQLLKAELANAATPSATAIMADGAISVSEMDSWLED